jgi:hypothetical protein
MSLQKSKMTDFGVEGNYWTIISSNLTFHPYPKFVLDENNNLVGLENAPSSPLVIALFVSKEVYDAQASGVLAYPLEIKEYAVPFMDALSSQRDPSKTGEQHAYDWIKANDSFFSDAVNVP